MVRIPSPGPEPRSVPICSPTPSSPTCHECVGWKKHSRISLLRGWGFGMSVRTRRTHLGPSVGSYGWPGFYGTTWYNAPAEDLTAIFVMQRAHAGDQTLPMWLDLWTAVYQAIDD